MVDYNLEQHKKLLKEQTTTRESPELRSYRIAIEEHILWQERDQIILFLENLLIGKIDADTFCDFTHTLRRKVIEGGKKFESELISNSSNIKDFHPDSERKKFNGLLTAFFCKCENLSEDNNENAFYNSMNTLLSNLECVQFIFNI